MRARSPTTWSRRWPRAAACSRRKISPPIAASRPTPIESRYRDLDVVEMPPNGQGVAALLLLNMLERFDMASLDPVGADRLHLLIEAGRLAYAVRNLYVADPAFMQMPVLRCSIAALPRNLPA